MCSNLEYLKDLNSRVRELASLSKETNKTLKAQLVEKLNDHMLSLGEHVNQYSSYMEDMCKSMHTNRTKEVVILLDDSYKGSKEYATSRLAFSFQNLKTTTGMKCRKMFTWDFYYCGSKYTAYATISDENNISFSGMFTVDETIKAFKELLLVNKGLIMSTIDGWIGDAYRSIIDEQVRNMGKAESALLRDCVLYGIS